MRRFHKIFLVLLIFSAMAVLHVGCGGGGGTSGGTDPSPSASPSQSPTPSSSPTVTFLRRASVSGTGVEGNGRSWDTGTGEYGRYVVFSSQATNLVDNDTNNATDIFVKDTENGTIERVSVSSDGTQGDGDSNWPSISSDGKYVCFHSDATNLVTGDNNSSKDVFVHNRETGETICVSLNSSNETANGSSLNGKISYDGKYVAFHSNASDIHADANSFHQIYRYDMSSKTLILVSKNTGGTGAADAHCYYPFISQDGRFIAYQSAATNLVTGDGNGLQDVFLYDADSGTNERVSIATDDTEGNAASSRGVPSMDGRYVSFYSEATNLVSGDTNGNLDVFLRDRQLNTTIRVSKSSGGDEGNDDSRTNWTSPDGAYVFFESTATNLISGDTNGFSDIFIYDVGAGQVIDVVTKSTNGLGNGDSYQPHCNSDGSIVSFSSKADNLVDNDNDGNEDAFVKKWK